MSMFDVSPNFVNRGKAVSSRLQAGGIYIGIVTQVSGTSVYVRIPKLSGSAEYGPCATTGVMPSVGDKVLMGFLDNRLTELVCFGLFEKSAASALVTFTTLDTTFYDVILSADYANKIVQINPDSWDFPITIVVPSDTTRSIPIGSRFTFMSLVSPGALTVQLLTDDGVSINSGESGTFIFTQEYADVYLTKRSSNNWILSGAVTWTGS